MRDKALPFGDGVCSKTLPSTGGFSQMGDKDEGEVEKNEEEALFSNEEVRIYID